MMSRTNGISGHGMRLERRQKTCDKTGDHIRAYLSVSVEKGLDPRVDCGTSLSIGGDEAMQNSAVVGLSPGAI